MGEGMKGGEVNCHAQLKHGRRLAMAGPDFNRFWVISPLDGQTDRRAIA